MTTTPTAEAFLSTPYPDEPDEDVLESLPADPLESIAASLGLLTSIIVRRDNEDREDDETRQALDQADAEHAELLHENERLRQLITDTLKICKPSTSKLANNIRALLEVDTVTAPAEPDGGGEEDELVQPALDAPVEEWRTYARAFAEAHDWPVNEEVLGSSNRSQIRTMLGISQTEGGA